MEDLEKTLKDENQENKVEQIETEQKAAPLEVIEEKQKSEPLEAIEEEQKIETLDTIEEKEDQKENSLEASNEPPSESVEIKTEDANTTNCLALTIQEDHKLVAFKNVVFRSIRMSWKVVISAITLALLKLFS